MGFKLIFLAITKPVYNPATPNTAKYGDNITSFFKYNTIAGIMNNLGKYTCLVLVALTPTNIKYVNKTHTHHGV